MKPRDFPVDPEHIWEHFYQLTRIPRPSRAEAAVRDYVIGQAEAHDCRWQLDATGNLVVYVPASPGREGHATVIIQNHLDMVTVKTGDKQHDFYRDPLQLKVEDGWLLADRTTLGADNGLGCAAALALLTDPDVQHPPLELLFTVDEETGLGGALGLDASLLSGRVMLNLDTEDWHELYVGCAGGAGWVFSRDYGVQSPAAEFGCWTLELKGLAGGHSGIEIHLQLGNALKLLVEALDPVGSLQLAAASVGVAHNVIPREGSISFACSSADAEALQRRLEGLQQRWRSYLPAADHSLELLLYPCAPAKVMSNANSRDLLRVLAALPHGAQAYSLEQPADLVDLSINLARLQLAAGKLELESSLRFFNPEQAAGLRMAVEGLAQLAGLHMKRIAGYPGWQPDFASPLLARGKALHERLFDSVPAVKAIHAGLECGILKSKLPDADILSFGPTIRGAHSPTERLCIATVAPFWRYLTALLAEL
ncbi:beta-Ala-His dipeptidase [Haliea salexigens]|jgi:dipeptidase D|uniref:beta-Ala-His dipeptidase n=1 Tax=Haliea salexigens TaxID=287487 RepID=UPI00041ECBF9|nr:beta-Ala-His dipeptidase [Haliea salexigens]|tara:strand:- start:23870 stop:25312 length:1443 start_codon:yes stop_codon:yes gene_type:complete